ncbi:unnamed protein product [Adineta steineri]|uniref:RanBP2-type domain-containing protein n=1 Tax=Adineta steineri TaxID=433720 RepID=A0A815D6S9_9BILA|nr:unnamed protein product [Adineta steineri]CAF1293707.1 unnamed protein product [Adineta steineri]CAF1301880.1 unnamed protein product [Adineta steineri]CAF3922427.1 unnamed protein product [Adineta steineri]CAF4122299.1 unnamed protein product [Adineta steineri]
MYAAPWLCDNCGKANGITRYQCQQCRGINTYDLCDQCIVRAHITHPNHTFKLVQQAGTTVSSTPGWTQPSYSQWPGYYYTYPNQRQPSWKITYEYKTI